MLVASFGPSSISDSFVPLPFLLSLLPFLFSRSFSICTLEEGKIRNTSLQTMYNSQGYLASAL